MSPVEASSGKTQRRSLNRGSDRRANCALHTIVLSRLRWDLHPDYVAHGVADGKTRREALRCLKRDVAARSTNSSSPEPNPPHRLSRVTSMGALSATSSCRGSIDVASIRLWLRDPVT